MDNETSLIEWVEIYAKLGLAIHPLKADKSPHLLRWEEKATTDPAILRTWWHRWPDALIGCATGKSSNGICVIDMDRDDEKGKDGYRIMRDWQRSHGDLPDSWQSITGRGGYHYFFRADTEVKNRIGIITDVDVRGDGGYVVLPPSLHPNGKRYEWEYAPDDIQIADINDTIRFFLQTGKDSKTRFIAPETIPNGERNGSLFQFACMMQAKGASDEAVYAATKAENLKKCSEPLDDEEIKTIVSSALKYEKGISIFYNSDGTVTQGKRDPLFALDKNGHIKKTWDNIREAIEYDPALYDRIRFNELANTIYIYGELPWEKRDTYRAWRNSDDASLKAYLEKRYGFNSTEKIMDALVIVSDQHRFNPVVDELERIHNKYGSCKGAIRKLLPKYMGSDDTEYNYEVMKIYMLGAISRAYHAGCKFDYTLILYGAQGFGKSEFLRQLAINPEWFNDNFNTFDGDKAIEKLNGMWIVEMAELKALKSAKDSESFKSFLTSRVDTYRAPYSRRAEARKRMCVFAGTTNNKNVFVDKTGNRRFLPVIAKKGNEIQTLFKNQEETYTDFCMAWAEAMDIFLAEDKTPNLVLPEHLLQVVEGMQEEFSEDDYRVGVIQEWLDKTDCSKVCVPMLIEYALDRDVSKTSKQEKREVMEIMDNEIKGWSRIQNRNQGRSSCGKYGNQISFIRDFE